MVDATLVLIGSSVVLGAIGLFLFSHVRRLRSLARDSPGLSTAGSMQQTYNQQYENYDHVQEHAASVSSMFYDLVTDFYTYGWGLSFHFAPRAPHESFQESLRRHEYHLALQLDLKPGKRCLDVGCGVGGPMMNIARFTGAGIVGINNNEYQLKVANRLVKEQGLDDLISTHLCDWMKTGLPDESFDAAYGCEATCHAADRSGCYGEVFRQLKPGGLFAVYDYALTDKYDANNAEHKKAKEWAESTNGMPSILPREEIIAAMKQAGFEVLRAEDLNNSDTYTKRYPIKWYAQLRSGFSLSGLPHTSVGRTIVNRLLVFLEYMKLVPHGSTATHSMLIESAESLCKVGELNIVSPSFLVVARKPQASTSSA